MAFSTRNPAEGVIFHSDRGCQYTSKDFANLARSNGVVLSVGRKGDCLFTGYSLKVGIAA